MATIYKLLIKTHIHTGLRYLCITKSKDPYKYRGSGIYWNRHLNVHGNHVHTEIILQTENYDDLVFLAKFYSDLFDVAASPQWANLIKEEGYAHIGQKDPTINKKRSSSAKNVWNKLSYEDKIEKMKFCHEGRRTWFSKSDEDAKKKYLEKLSLAQKLRHSKTPFHVTSALMSQQRLNMTPEKKAARKAKIQAVYASGKHDAMFEKMSKDRMGSGNPASRPILWDGMIFDTGGHFQQHLKDNGLSKAYGYSQLNDESIDTRKYLKPKNPNRKDSQIVCEHCGKKCGNKTTYIRFHGDKCKERTNEQS